MSIECDNTTPLGSKAAAEILNENSSALLDAIIELSEGSSANLNSDESGNINDMLDTPLSTLTRADLNAVSGSLNNILLQTPLDEFPVLQDRLLDGGAVTVTDITEFAIANNTDIATLKTALDQYNTTLPDLSSLKSLGSKSDATTGSVSDSDTTGTTGTGTGTTSNTLNTGSGDTTIIGGANNLSTPSTFSSTSSSSASNIGANIYAPIGGKVQIYGSATRGDLTVLLPSLIYDLFKDLDFHFAINLGQKLTAKACGAYNDVLADVSKAFAVIQTGKARLSEIVDFTKIVDPKDLIEAIKQRASLEGIVSLLESVVKGVVEAAKKVVMAAAGTVLVLLKGLEAAAKPIIDKLKKMTSHINTFLEDPSIDKIKTGIEAVVADLASQFEKLTPENVANMMYRLCQQAQDLQATLMAPAMELNKFANSVGSQAKLVVSRQAEEMKNAVKYGAIRVSDEDRDAKQKDVVGTYNSNVKPSDEDTGYVTPSKMTQEQMSAIVNISKSGLGSYVTFDSAVIDYEDGDGWKEVGTHVWKALLLTQSQTDKSYVVTRGYQKPKKDPNTKYKVHSLYSKGSSVDIRVTTTDYRETIVAASRAGFTHIGVYKDYVQLAFGKRKGFLHFSTPSDMQVELKEMLDKHEIDGYRIKRT